MSHPKLQETKQQLEHYWQLYKSHSLSGPDITGLFWLSYYNLFTENLSFQIQLKNKHFDLEVEHSYSFVNDPFIMNLLKLKSTYGITNLYQLFNSVFFKNTKSITNKALCLWYQNKFQLEIMDFIPSPLEVLKLQTHSKRCMSLLKQEYELTCLYDHERNVQQFLLHDLEHAWQMFGDPHSTFLQVELSKKLLNLYESGVLQFLQGHPETKKSLDYIFSDMNTHPEHTLCSLKALVLNYYKLNQASLMSKTPLGLDLEKQFNDKWDEIINNIDFMSKIG